MPLQQIARAVLVHLQNDFNGHVQSADSHIQSISIRQLGVEQLNESTQFIENITNS